jgi:hypothetical protein
VASLVLTYGDLSDLALQLSYLHVFTLGMFFASLLAFFSPRVYVAAAPRRRLRHVCLPAAAAAVAAATVVVGPSLPRCQSRSIPGGARFAAALSLDIRRRIFHGRR